MKKTIFVTGGAGFIGKQLIHFLAKTTNHNIVNIDKLTYASALPEISDRGGYTFCKIDICNTEAIRELFEQYKPDVVMHLAAESHVDRSISGPEVFIQSNIIGTFTMLEQARRYWDNQLPHKKENFRFLHVSTDEVYGDLGADDPAFTERTSYAPSSPYSASKASSDHLVRAWFRTYGLPVLITNCSNNYGPGQFPEKLIPLMIHKAKEGLPLPVYGDGQQVRDWLYVQDHVKALWTVVEKGVVGETYNIGGMNELKNIDVVKTICVLMENFCEKPNGLKRYEDLISFVKDRSGHDRRYAIDCTKICHDLGWKPEKSFEAGMKETVEWYLALFASRQVGVAL